MTDTNGPRSFPEWRTDPSDRAEDAAYLFGSAFIEHCRTAVVREALQGAGAVTAESIEAAVDSALHNVMDLLEGFWRIDAGASHTAEFALSVRVRDAAGALVESVDLSPSKLDLPIGYWKWRDGEFR